MPGSGQPSRGCYRCRSKKVKCDQSRPECQRCKNSHIACPGYRPAEELLFRHMNRNVENKFKTIQTKRAENKKQLALRDQADRSRHQVETNSSFQDSPPSTSLVSLPRPMPIDWHNEALCSFFTNYVFKSKDPKAGPGWLENFEMLWDGKSDDALTHAVTACSLSTFSNRAHSPTLREAARISYGKSLSTLQKSLSEKAAEDTTLGAVFCLNLYEIISGERPYQYKWGSHADAIAFLLRLRGSKQYYSPPNSYTGLVRMSHAIVMITNILQRRLPGPEIDFYEQYAEKGHYFGIPRAYHRIAKILPLADSVLRRVPLGESSDEELLQVLAIAQTEDRNFELWEHDAQEPFVYWSVNRESLLRSNTAKAELPDVVHCYKDILIPGFWNTYRAARIVLLQTIAQLVALANLQPGLSSALPDIEQIGLKAFNDMRTTVSDIFASIPYALGQVNERGWTPRDAQPQKAFVAMNLILPLRIVLMADTLTAGQRNYVFEQLDCIHEITGVVQAAAVKNMSQQ